MNKLLRKAAAFITAGLMASASFGAECYAESAKQYTASAELNYAAAVAKPTYAVKGTAGVRKIKLSTSTSGATIYYTTNGKTPTTKSKKYTGGLLLIRKDTKICAIAVKGSSKSATMVKTFRVATKYGDVTGDGKINSTDYTRLKNFLAGKTSYICKDNADCDGSGGISSKDLTVLSQYLSGKISRLPSSPIATVKKPTATKAKIYGGMRITLKTTVSGGTIYYTTNGSTPTTNSTRYSSPFILTDSRTIKAIVYKNGESSSALTFSADVGTTQSVQADKNTSSTYNEPIEVRLSCYTSNSLIYYTTDGSDPRTSSTTKSYSSAIKLSQDTTIKAYARSKGNVDSEVSVFSYRVNGGFTISGNVWDDTPGSTSSTSSSYNSSSTMTANGQKTSNEPGISGIAVYLINSTTNAEDAPNRYIQRTVTDYNGNYTFSGLTQGTNYKVVFEYNYQKYRAYANIVSGGNQAVCATRIPDIKIEDNGAYVVSGYSESYLNNITSYNNAISSSNYTAYAITSNSFSSTNNNVNLALISKNYGVLTLDMSVSGATNNKIANGKKLTYTLTLSNYSPVASTILSDCEIAVYLTDVFSDYNLNQRTASLNTNSGYMGNGARYLLFTDFVGSGGLAPGKTATISFEALVDADPNTRIEAYAEVLSYRFSTSCYDYYSAPGNMSNFRVSQNDEASTPVITVTEGSGETTQTISAITARTAVEVGASDDYLMFVVENCTSQNDILPGEMSPQNCLTYTPTYTTVNGNLYVTVTVYGNYPGEVSIPFYLRKDPSKSVVLYATVYNGRFN